MVLTDSHDNRSDGDFRLIEGLRSRNRGVIEQIYKQHFEMIQSLIVHNNGSSEDAADIFQEAMIVLYEKSLRPDFELRCRLKTFLYSICRRLWLKKLQQSRGKIIKVELLEDTVPVDEEIDFHEERQLHFNLMEKALGKLGEPCRSLLQAYYTQNKSMQLIAAEFGYTNAENAKTQKYKCLMRLKKIFFADYKNVK